ncbi:hypothetical protein C8U37_103191 [Trichococcus patagoniensis]|uniref:Uncharacterized protein n=1 Tax=Trichococcus patagoniensis TaxID=382641 RepID=A0A2T5IPP4_9LACT|nr:DUF6512 family protein [Trichococcus patagoniensis]PTQ85802.1 hypothetical protein C8U37_103191 [Trichococcus patagoniensis]
MTEKRTFLSEPFVVRSFVAGIPFVLMLGGLSHFAFAWFEKASWAAPFVPVNESVWEHLKMSYWSTLLWFFFIFLFSGKKYRLSPPRWLLAGIVSMLFCPLLIVTGFYTLKGAFNIESLFTDGMLFFIGIISGQLLALRTYRYGEPRRIWLGMAAVLWLLFTLALVLFSYHPPALPLFLDTPTGSYGF